MKNNKSLIISVLSIILVIIFGAGTVCLLSKGFKSWEMFKTAVATQTAEDTEEPVSMKLNFAGNYGVVNPIIFGDQALSDITAEIYPLTATGNHVLWYVAWENPDSDFAQGKKVTNYVEVYPREAFYDGYSLNARIKYCQPFGEPVIVTCVSSTNPEIKDTCRVQCLQKIEGVYLELHDYDNLNEDNVYRIGADNLTVDINPAYMFFDNLLRNETAENTDPVGFKLKSEFYTKTDNILSSVVSIKRSDSFIDKLNEVFGTYYEDFNVFYDNDFSELNRYTAFDYGEEDLYVNISDFYCLLFRGAYKMKDLERSNLFYQKGGKSDCLYNLYARAVQETEGALFSIKFTLLLEQAGAKEFVYDISYGGAVRQLVFVEN